MCRTHSSGAWSRNSPDYNGLALRMKPACVKAGVARKSRGPKRPYGFDSRPEHEGQFLKIAPFYKSLIISTLLLSGFICLTRALPDHNQERAFGLTATMVINNICVKNCLYFKLSEYASTVLPFHSPGQVARWAFV